MKATDIQPFFGRVFNAFPTFGKDKDEWVATVSSQVARFTPAPTQMTVRALVAAVLNNSTELPTVADLRQHWATIPTVAAIQLAGDAIAPEMELVVDGDLSWSRPACRACHGTGIYSRWMLTNTPRPDAYPLADRFEDQRTGGNWIAIREAARALQAELPPNKQLVEMASWCLCSYGRYRKKTTALACAARQSSRADRRARDDEASGE